VKFSIQKKKKSNPSWLSSTNKKKVLAGGSAVAFTLCVFVCFFYSKLKNAISSMQAKPYDPQVYEVEE
jgi:hypothetical protein